LNKLEMLEPGSDFLDIGCGCGRLTRHLVDLDINSYTGFDRHPGMIEWCRKEISSVAPHFTFDLFELKSAYDEWDQIDGSIDAAEFHFPYEDKAFDSILLASVFTHMPLNESGHYLTEMQRVLKPSGKVLLSVFLTDGEPYSEQIDFFYRKKDFERAIKSAGLKGKFLMQTARHCWYVLKRK
ncbi:MAG: class I SAM-dependent methyltransferase, partial [Saprospiraceae bacterium]|nr:class I SAM-dependent methyltransferase [Saprospiraceae bacterium]